MFKCNLIQMYSMNVICPQISTIYNFQVCILLCHFNPKWYQYIQFLSKIHVLQIIPPTYLENIQIASWEIYLCNIQK